MVAIMSTAIFMFAGIGIDFARMFTYANQLKVLTDAAALSAITDLKAGQSEANARGRAIALREKNRVDGNGMATIADADVEPGVWTFGSGCSPACFTPSDWVDARAVRVTARYDASWILARIFGATTRSLTQRSVAALGGQVASSCLKPFAIPYGALLTRVGRLPTDLGHTLTAAEVAMLESNPAPIWFDMNVGGAANIPGQFGWVGFPPGIGNNKNAYLGSVIPPGCQASPAAVGNILPAINGSMNSVTSELGQLCPGTGDSRERICTPAPSFEVPIYDLAVSTGNNDNVGGTKVGYRVKYIGAFTLTETDLKGSNSRIRGRLTSLNGGSSGGFSSFPGPVQTAALVQ